MKLFNFDPTQIIPRSRPMGRGPKYPWTTIEIGQGFSVSEPDAPTFKSMRVQCYQRGAELKRTFRAQETNENGVRTIHVGRFRGPHDITVGTARPLPSTTPGKPLKLDFDIENYTEKDFDEAPTDAHKLNLLKPFEYFIWKDSAYYENDYQMIYHICSMQGMSQLKHFVVQPCLYKGKQVVLIALTNKVL